MPSVDRSKTSPFLLRCFIRPQTHSNIEFFNPNAPALQKSEYGIYVWKDTTLRELIVLLRSVGAAYHRPGNAKFSIRHVYASSASSDSRDSRIPVYNHKDLGFVFARDLAGEDFLEERGASGRGGGRSDPSIRTLEHHRVIPGDYIEIAFITAVAGPNMVSSGPPGSSHVPFTNSRQPLPGSSSGPQGLLNRMNGPSDADKAWGVAGDMTGRRRPGGPSGGNRFNPLLSGSNGRPVGDRRGEAAESTGGGRGMSIMGAGRRASASGDAAANGSSREHQHEEDGDRPSRRRDSDEEMKD